MFSRDLFRSTFGYSFWANAQVLQKAGLVTPAEFVEDLGVGHGSLQLALLHVLTMEQVWFALITTGEAPDTIPKVEDFPDAGTFVQAWKPVEVGYLQYLDRAAEADLLEIVSTKDQNGIVTPIPRWRMLQQVLYHSAQHRTEAALILTHLGQSPGNLDFINY